ncbi:lipopolysaccharide cholinephosphotransferase [Lachnospiraceae bacterium]|nr:lipopolysaccharide cholinephosphotransferase [Lachnospiraceae bacterium]
MKIELDEDKLHKIHKVELELLQEFDRVCKKNNLHYTVTGGTLLGAVRHGGFIPWDDDADVVMLREDYDKFQKICKRDLDHSKFYFQDIETTPGYRWGYGKLRRKDTVFLREGQEGMPYEQGIFMDIFPRDGIPDGKIAGKVHTFLCFCLRKIMWSEVGKTREPNRIIRLVYRLVSHIPQKTIVWMYRKLIGYSNHKETKLVRALTFPLPKRLAGKGYLRKWYNNYQPIQFEDITVQAEANYLDWLKAEFGDYMALPPVEKRKSHPVTQLRFPEEGN